jgi:hypothetical protein
MKTRFRRRFFTITVVVLLHSWMTAFAQTNSWTNTVGGKWEDPYWSLGILPGTNQTIYITDSGLNVVTIGPSTAENFPASLSMDSLTISSTTNSTNTLLLNNAGFNTPLTANQLEVSAGSQMLVYSSSLKISDIAIVEGTLIQEAGSQVSNNYTPVVGSYHLNSGMLTGAVERIYSNGRFIQSGGTNYSPDLGIMTTIGAPEYDLNGGEFDGAIEIGFAGTFRQNGGIANVTAIRFEPTTTFIQSGGNFNGPTNSRFAIPTDLVSGPTNASALQSGGTNHEYRLVLGAQTHAEIDCTFGCYRPNYGGTYTLSNGVLTTDGTSVTANGNFQQCGGTHAISSDLNIEGSIYYVAGGGPAYTGPLGVDYKNLATYFLNGGFLSADNARIGVAGSLDQSDGIVAIANSLTLAGPGISESGRGCSGSYALRGGTVSAPALWMLDGSQFHEDDGSLLASNLTVYAATFTQDGGSNEITCGVTIYSLTVSNWNSYYGMYEIWTYTGSYQLNNGILAVSNLALLDLGQFSQSGGQLTVHDMQLAGGAFLQIGGNILQSGLLTFGNSIWRSAPGNQQLGQLQLVQTNSVLSLPTNACKLQFGDSSSLTWASNSLLDIQNWSGSLYGGGAHRIIFGTNATALTPQQLTQIQFQNPSGLAPGNYPARILSTGEIVPDTGAPLPPVANLVCATNGLMHLAIGGDIGRTYTIEVSTDLVHWNTWTDQFNSTGTMTLDDNDSTNCPQRYYRAHLVP